MSGRHRTAPAWIWRAFFFVAVAGLARAASSSPALPPLAQVGKPDAAEIARILEQFRHAGFFGYFELELHRLPRRGAETVYRGRLWGGRNDQGAAMRIELTDEAGATHRFLLHQGAQPAIWRERDGSAVPVDVAASFAPLLPGLEITAFDLQMPYLYWPDVTVESVVRMRGRPAYAFVFRPPAEFAAAHRELTAVRAYFDAQFSAPTQTELIGGDKVLKTIALLDLKKLGERYIPKAFDLRNELTHDKTRFVVIGAALDAEFAADVFAPASLGTTVQPPAGVVAFEP